jgi:hypothetical protein
MVAHSGQAGRPQSSHNPKVRWPQRLQGRKKPPSRRCRLRVFSMLRLCDLISGGQPGDADPEESSA